MGSEMCIRDSIRDVLGTETNTGLSFHSLRHHLSGALKASEAPLGISQEITGHSSGSITYDLYGAAGVVKVSRMAEVLRAALLVSTNLPDRVGE